MKHSLSQTVYTYKPIRYSEWFMRWCRYNAFYCLLSVFTLQFDFLLYYGVHAYAALVSYGTVYITFCFVLLPVFGRACIDVCVCVCVWVKVNVNACVDRMYQNIDSMR